MNAPKTMTAPLTPVDLDLLRKHVDAGGRVSQGTAKLLLVTAEQLLERLIAPKEVR